MDTARKIEERSAARTLAYAFLWCSWQVIRLPALGLLTILAPLVRLLLTGFALVMTLTAFFFEFASGRDFPFLGMLALSLGALALLAIYDTVLTLLSGRAQ